MRVTMHIKGRTVRPHIKRIKRVNRTRRYYVPQTKFPLFNSCVILLLVLLFVYLNQSVMLCDSAAPESFQEFAERLCTINCLDPAVYDEAIAFLKAGIKEREAVFSDPRLGWVRDLLAKKKITEDVSSAIFRIMRDPGQPENTFKYFYASEEKAPQHLLKHLDNAIANDKCVDFCKQFKRYIIEHQPIISYYLIEQFFYRHLNHPNISPAERLLNKQLHNLFLRDLYTSFEVLERHYKIKKNTYFDEMTRLYMQSWQLQTKYNISWDLAFHIAIKQNFIANVMMSLFFIPIMDELAVSIRDPIEYHKALYSIADVYLPVHAYFVETNTMYDMIFILEYWQRTCAAGGSCAAQARCQS